MVAHEVGRGLVHGGVDDLALAGLEHAVVAGQGAAGGEEGGGDVADQGVGGEVGAVGHALHGGKAAEGLAHGIDAGLAEVAVHAAVLLKAVARDVDDDELGIGGHGQLVRRAVLAYVGHAVYPDVALLDEVNEDFLGLGHLVEVHVELEAVHVAAEAYPLGDDAGLGAAADPGGVAGAGDLDLDDLRAHVAQPARREGARESDAGQHHSQTVEGAVFRGNGVAAHFSHPFLAILSICFRLSPW